MLLIKWKMILKKMNITCIKSFEDIFIPKRDI